MKDQLDDQESQDATGQRVTLVFQGTPGLQDHLVCRAVKDCKG